MRSQAARLRLLVWLWRCYASRQQALVQRPEARWLLRIALGLSIAGAFGWGLLVAWMFPLLSLSLHTLHSALSGQLLLWPLLLSLWQKGPRLPVHAWLAWPIARTLLAHALQMLSLLHGANAALLFFLLGIWVKGVAPSFSLASNLGWLTTAGLLLTFSQWITNGLRILRYTYPTSYVLIWIGGVVGIRLLIAQNGLSWLAGQTFDRALTQPASGLWILLVLNICCYLLALVPIRKSLFLDHNFLFPLSSASSTRPRWTGSAIWRLVRLQMLLIWRHRITRIMLFLPLLFGLMGSIQLEIGLQQNAKIYTALGILLLLIPSLQILNNMLGWQGTFAAALFTWPISYRDWGKATLWVASGAASIGFLTGAGIVSLINPSVLIHLLVLYSYLVGWVHPVLLLQAPSHAIQIQLESRSLISSGTASLRRPFRLIGLILLLIGLAVGGVTTGKGGLLMLAVLGGMGLFMLPLWLDLLELQIRRQKHSLLVHLQAV